jgi:hypothetical protein
MLRKISLIAGVVMLSTTPAAVSAEPAGGHQYGVIDRCVRLPWGQSGWWWQWVPCNSGAFNL